MSFLPSCVGVKGGSMKEHVLGESGLVCYIVLGVFVLSVCQELMSPEDSFEDEMELEFKRESLK